LVRTIVDPLPMKGTLWPLFVSIFRLPPEN
jgi:hypothetical protein